MTTRHVRVEDYAYALQAFAGKGARDSLVSARRFGRMASEAGLNVRDLVDMHRESLKACEATMEADVESGRLQKRAGTFFLEVVLPVGDTIQGMRKTNLNLADANKVLRQRSQDLAAANRELKREVARRKRVETSLTESKKHYSLLLEQSRQMQDELRRLSHQLLLVQEEERKAISRELHDQIAQTLTGINVHLASLKSDAASDLRGLNGKISRTQKMVEQSIDVVHRFARELRPTMLDDLGLIPALHAYMKGITQRSGLHISLSAFSGINKLDSDKSTVLYRVVQSALTNVMQHADATSVSVRIRKLKNDVRLEIKDNGKGFDPKCLTSASKKKRLGILGMRERVEVVGGTFALNSSPGEGAAIGITIPYQPGAKPKVLSKKGAPRGKKSKGKA